MSHACCVMLGLWTSNGDDDDDDEGPENGHWLSANLSAKQVSCSIRFWWMYPVFIVLRNARFSFMFSGHIRCDMK